jgi:hypothetical protein
MKELPSPPKDDTFPSEEIDNKATDEEKKEAAEKNRDRAILITENTVQIVGIVKISAEMTSFAGPLKAACGITETVLTRVKVTAHYSPIH